MLRKTTAAVVLAGALALGTASATSLGTFNDVTFAAGDVDLLDCPVGTEAVPADLVQLIPDIPDTGELDASGLTVDLGLLNVTSLVTDLGDIEGVDCVTGKVLDLVLLDGDGDILTSIEGIALDGAGLDAIDPGVDLDITRIADVRAVLRDA